MKSLKVVVKNENGKELKLKTEIKNNGNFKVNYCEFECDENNEYDIETIIKRIR